MIYVAIFGKGTREGTATTVHYGHGHCTIVMSEGVLIAIRTSVSTYVERPICMDVMCFGNHAAYDAHKSIG